MTRIYRPHAIRQALRFDGHLIGCTDTCLAMLTDAATVGGVRVSERTVRGLSDETQPDPKSPGLNLTQLVDVAHKLRIQLTDRTGMTRSVLAHDLTSGRRVIVQLWYAGIGGTAIGHAVYLNQRRKHLGHWQVLMYDPMKSRPRWIAEKRVMDAAA